MASNSISLMEYKAEVYSCLELALKASGTSLLGEYYSIKKLQKEQFFQNVSIMSLNCQFKLFIPSKVYEESNDLDTAFHVKGDPTRRKGSKSNELQLKGGLKAGVPNIFAKVIKLCADANALVHMKSSEECVVNSEPIPSGAKLRREKGYDVFVCQVEVSLRVPSLQVGFYVWKLFKDEVKTVPARTILSKLQGWDESRGTAIIEIEHQVEAEHHVITNIET